MKEHEIEFLDPQRFFIGEVPVGFLIEAVIRILFLFFLIVFSMRMIGRRMSSSLNRNDMAAMVSIAAAIGVPMQDPLKGLLPPLIIAVIVIISVRTLNWFTYRKKTFERLLQGSFSILVKDGIINHKNLKDQRISRERLFAELRSEHIFTLGLVQRVYLESSGSYTIVKSTRPRPGLPVVPDWDKDFLQGVKLSSNLYACENCGWLNENKKVNTCPKCKEEKWTRAVMA